MVPDSWSSLALSSLPHPGRPPWLPCLLPGWLPECHGLWGGALGGEVAPHIEGLPPQMLFQLQGLSLQCLTRLEGRCPFLLRTSTALPLLPAGQLATETRAAKPLSNECQWPECSDAAWSSVALALSRPFAALFKALGGSWGTAWQGHLSAQPVIGPGGGRDSSGSRHGHQAWAREGRQPGPQASLGSCL